MKAQVHDRIQLIKDVCYGSAYGLVSVPVGTILDVASRNSSDDGIYTKQTVTLQNELGKETWEINVWDNLYTILVK